MRDLRENAGAIATDRAIYVNAVEYQPYYMLYASERLVMKSTSALVFMVQLLFRYLPLEQQRFSPGSLSSVR